MAPSTPRGAEALFEQLVGRFSADPLVTPPSVGKGGRFGASGLKVGGKLFAMLSKDELILKLPRERVDELVASGNAKPFDPGHGRLMKEWAAISPRNGPAWSELADEARQFVAAGAPGSRRRSS